MPSRQLGSPVKIVLDTNNLISAQINKKGASCKIFRLFLQGEIVFFTSNFQIKEFRKVLSYKRIGKKFKLTLKKRKEIVSLLEKHAVKIHPQKIPSVISEDPDDNHILAIALERRVDFIISGDEHLLELKRFKGIPIVSAREFLEIRF